MPENIINGLAPNKSNSQAIDLNNLNEKVPDKDIHPVCDVLRCNNRSTEKIDLRITSMNKKISKESILHQGQNRQFNVVNHLVVYLLMQPRSKARGLYYKLSDHLESGFDVIPFKISYFKYDDRIYQWIIVTCKREVERYLKRAIIQFAQSQDVPIINPSFRVRLRGCK